MKFAIVLEVEVPDETLLQRTLRDITESLIDGLAKVPGISEDVTYTVVTEGDYVALQRHLTTPVEGEFPVPVVYVGDTRFRVHLEPFPETEG